MPRANQPDPAQLAADAFDRRTFMSRVAAAAGMAGLGLGALRPAAAATGKGADAPSMNTDGTYPVVPLTRDSVSLAVMQTRVRPVDAARPETGRRENLEHMLELIDNTQTYGPVKDILFFHEFPITGFRFEWNRADVLRVAIEVPGPETEVLARKAKQYGCYIVFGSYVRDDKDWPNHSLSITTILGPDGSIVDRHWKARNIMGVFTAGREPIELMTSTIYNCFDRFVEMYGVDAVIPVTRTPIGNICTSSVQREPELFRAMTLKGAEIFLRTATGGFTPADIQACAMYNGVYTAICNNSISPGNKGIWEDAGGGNSAVYDPRGEIIAKAASGAEQEVDAVIPIASYRARHRLPEISWAMYAPVYAHYVNNYPPSKYTQSLPPNLQEAAKYLRDPKNRNWK
jgi:predicted amidohydrolase